jgi:hypothetical protein
MKPLYILFNICQLKFLQKQKKRTKSDFKSSVLACKELGSHLFLPNNKKKLKKKTLNNSCRIHQRIEVLRKLHSRVKRGKCSKSQLFKNRSLSLEPVLVGALKI